MSRLYDKLLESNSPRIPDAIRSSLTGIPVFKVDNVVEYFYDIIRDYSSRRTWAKSHIVFPNIAPPYEKFYMESRRAGPHQEPFGVLFHAMPVDEVRKTHPRIPSSFKWIYHITYIDERDGEYVASVTFSIGVEENGGAVHDERKRLYRTVLKLDEEAVSREVDGITEIDAIWHLRITPLLMALSFMHCKNVMPIEHKPPAKIQQKRKRQKKEPKTKYYALEIEPMKKVLKTEGRVDEVGLQRALHICRGHFKDYSQGNGLFGKYKGLYWWDSSVRGTPEAGRIEKDYSIAQIK